MHIRKEVVMQISADMLRGHTETMILRFLLEKDSYGYEINKNIRILSNNQYELNEATLYTAFKRLEKNGYITSYWGNEEKGARRKYYSITSDGKKNYQERIDEWVDTSKLINNLLGIK